MNQAIWAHDDGPIFTWLMEMISYQGISDRVAAGYMARNGIADASSIEAGLQVPELCPKLTSYWSFERCGYRKEAWACGEPDHRVECPLPCLRLRNGRLNQTAYSLWLFMRDACSGDFTAWLDERLAKADKRRGPGRYGLLVEAVVGPIRNVFGVSDKVLTMGLSALLLSESARRPLWATAGGAMIAIDSLVHAWLHRTGLLAELGRAHVYGAACYSRGNCADIVRRLSGEVDAREFNAEYPRVMPRLVQHAIWRFAAAGELNVCNGVNIDDRSACELDCKLANHCRRIPLHAGAVAR